MPDDQQPNAPHNFLLEQEQERELARTRGAATLTELKKQERGVLHKSLETLRPAVDERCRAEFLAAWGTEFSETMKNRLENAIRFQVVSMKTEQEARKIAEDIRELSKRILRFLRETPENHGGAWTRLLLENVLPGMGIDQKELAKLFSLIPTPQTLKPQAWLPEEKLREIKRFNFAPPQSNYDRLALVRVAEGEMATTADRPLVPRDLAILSCLLGLPWAGMGGPQNSTPTDIIRSEADSLKKILEREW